MIGIQQLFSFKKRELFFKNIMFLLMLFASIYTALDFSDEMTEDNTTTKFAYNSVPNKTVFQRIFNKMYVSVSTMTTLGYGDIYPIHPLSQFVVACQSLITFIIITELVSV